MGSHFLIMRDTKGVAIAPILSGVLLNALCFFFAQLVTWDRRAGKVVTEYEAHVNDHLNLKVTVDTSERFLFSGMHTHIYIRCQRIHIHNDKTIVFVCLYIHTTHPHTHTRLFL